MLWHYEIKAKNNNLNLKIAQSCRRAHRIKKSAYKKNKSYSLSKYAEKSPSRINDGSSAYVLLRRPRWLVQGARQESDAVFRGDVRTRRQEVGFPAVGRRGNVHRRSRFVFQAQR